MGGRIALVTGGSKGIGRAVALALAESGHRVAVGCASDKAGADETCAAIEALGSEALAFQADIADPVVLARLSAKERHSVVVSARTGEGIDELLAAIGRELPHPDREVRVLVPYERGDLINRIHQSGEFLTSTHTEDGTLLTARVNADLAGELAQYERSV